MTIKLNFEQDRKLDPNALDVEWMEQAGLAKAYGDYYNECQARKREAEEEIKVVRARLTLKANKYPDKYLGQGVKPTAPVVEAFYRTHKDHIAAKDEWLAACEECDAAEIAKWEISSTRKTALENLVQLYQSNYFAGPNMPRNLAEELEKRNAEVSKRVGEKLNKKK